MHLAAIGAHDRREVAERQDQRDRPPDERHCGAAAPLYAVIECSGASVDSSITGNKLTAAPASRPTITAHDPANARFSAVLRNPVRSAQAPATTIAIASQASGRSAIAANSAGLTIHVSIETANKPK